METIVSVLKLLVQNAPGLAETNRAEALEAVDKLVEHLAEALSQHFHGEAAARESPPAEG